MVLTVDDVHDAHADLRRMLTRLAHGRPDHLQILIAGRPRDDLVEWAAALGLDVIDVGPLDVDSVEALVGSERAAAVHEMTGGNPLFVNHLVQSRWSAGDPMPTSLHHLIRPRVTRLGRHATRAAAALAVDPHGVPTDVLARVIGGTSVEAADVLARMRSEDLVERRSDGRWTATHPIVRAAFDEMAAVDRTSLHGELLRSYEHALPRDLAARAFHAERAGEGFSSQAVDELERYAHELAASLRQTEAADVLVRAESCAARAGASAPRRGDLLLQTARCLARAQDRRWMDALDAAFDLAVETPELDPVDVAMATPDGLTLVDSTGEVASRYRAMARRALLLTRPSDHLSRAVLLANSARPNEFGGELEPDALHADLRRAWEELMAARPVLPRDAVAVLGVTCTVPAGFWRPGDLTKRDRATQLAIEAAQSTGRPSHLGFALLQRLWVCMELGALTEAEDWLALSSSLPQLGRQRMAISFRMVEAHLHTARGRFVEAADTLAAVTPAPDDPSPEATWHRLALGVTRFNGLLAQGRWQEVIDAQRVVPTAYSGPATSLLAATLAATGRTSDAEEARGLVRAEASRDFAGVPTGMVHIGTLADWAQAAATVRDTAACELLWRLLLPARGGFVHSRVVFGRHLSGVLAGLAAVLGRTDEAVRLGREAVAACERSRAWWQLAIEHRQLALIEPSATTRTRHGAAAADLCRQHGLVTPVLG